MPELQWSWAGHRCQTRRRCGLARMASAGRGGSVALLSCAMATATVLSAVALLLTAPGVATAASFGPAPGSPFSFGSEVDQSIESLTEGSFTGTGSTDLAVTNSQQGTITILLGNGAGQFEPAEGSPISVPGVFAIATGVFTSSSTTDLAVLSDKGEGAITESTVTVLEGNGKGQFTPIGSPIAVGEATAGSIAVGEFGPAGQQDLAIPTRAGVVLLEGNGTGEFRRMAHSPITAIGFPSNFAFAVAAGAFTGGIRHNDLAVLNGAEDEVSILLSNGSGEFTIAPGSPVSTGFGAESGSCASGCLITALSIATGDFNGDGKLDVAVGGYGKASVLLGKGNGELVLAPGSPASVAPEYTQLLSLAVADFNGAKREGREIDGLASADYWQGGGPGTEDNADWVSVANSNEEGRLSAAEGSPYELSGVATSVAAAPFTSNGRPDVAVTDDYSCHGSIVQTLLNDGPGGFTPAPSTFPGDGCPHVVLPPGGGKAPSPSPSPSPSPEPSPPPAAKGATSENGLGSPAPTCADHSVTLAGAITVQASCFHVTKGGQLVTSGHIRVNGLDIVISGSGGFTLDTKKLKLYASGQVNVYAGSLHIYHGKLSWDFKRKLNLGIPKNFKIKGLPASGEAVLTLDPGGVNAVLNASIGKKAFEVSGEIDLKLQLATGLQLSSFKLELASDLPIKGLLIHKATLSYESTKEGDVWKGAVEVELPAKGPTVEGDLTVEGGRISEVAVNVSGIDKPLGEVIFLQSLGLEVDFAPKLSATGSIGLSAGPEVDKHTAATLDGSLSATLGEPFVLEAKGTLSLVEDKLADASVKASIPGGVAFKGNLTASFAVIKLEGGISGEVSSNSFEAEGRVTIHAPGVNAKGDGLIDNAGIAGCAQQKISGPFGLSATVTIGASHRWGGANSIFNDSCGFGRLNSGLGARSAALTGTVASVRVPAHTRQLNLIVTGSGAPPQLRLSEHGATATVQPNTTGALGRSVYLAIGEPQQRQTDIAIADPPAGRLSVLAAPGQPAPVAVASSLPLPGPRVRLRLHRLGPRRYRVSWRARAIAGQRLLFQEQDARARTLLRASAASHGSFTFAAANDGASGSQRLRVLVEQDGLLREVLPGPRFRPAPLRLLAPRAHVRLSGGRAIVSWRGVRGASGYQVLLSTADGRRLFFAMGAKARSLRVGGSASVTARVRAVGAAGRSGPFATAHAKLRNRHPGGAGKRRRGHRRRSRGRGGR
ncbi:MAG: FG-GAP repeat domain-containing protein [Solirubrobacteraceae bacterium]